MSRFTAGLVAILGITVFSLGAWFKWNPFADPYRLNAVVSDTSNLGTRSPVRIAGIEVGKVTGVEPLDGGGGKVEMELREEALPIHEDAELKVRPRIFLGGNFFVELEPGTPNAPLMEDGGTIARDRASVSVQVPDVLAALSADTRRDLQTLLREGAKAVGGAGGEGLREGIPFLEPSLRDLALTADAALGEEPEVDLGRGLRGAAGTAGALAEDEEALKGLVTGFSATVGALAEEDAALEASIPALRDTLRAAGPALTAANASFPSLRTIAAEARPGVRVLGPATAASRPLLRQLRALLRPSELRGTARVLRRRAPGLHGLIEGSVGVFEQGRAASRCTSDVLVPFIESDFPDPDFPGNDGTVNQKLQRAFVGLAGESRTTDANQSYFHTSFVEPGTSVRPAPPPDGGVSPPPRRPDVPCETQEPPNLGAPGARVSPEGGLSPLGASNAAATVLPPAERKALLGKAKLMVGDWQKRLARRQARALREERSPGAGRASTAPTDRERAK